MITSPRLLPRARAARLAWFYLPSGLLARSCWLSLLCLRVAILGQVWLHAAQPVQAAAAPACGQSLQAQVDAAAPGSTVAVPACVYRETVTISKPLVLDGQGHAELRGSDVWANWSASNGLWLAGPAPNLPVVQDASRCAANTANRCLVPQQVFLDGRALQWVSGTPASGQFTIASGGQVALADNPAGHTVEVTTRQRWVITAADGVTIQGFTMKHAGNDAQSGAISNDRHANWTLQHNTLSDAHGDVVSVDYGSGTRVLSNDIARGGDLGLHGDHPSNLLVQGNTLHDNSTDGFAGSWEAGSIKMGAASGVVIDNNEIIGTQVGPGVWCDVACSNIVYSNNRVHDNASSGLFFEISNGATIVGNRVWNNNWSNVGWGSGGIVVSSSAHAEVYNNILAWNAGGIVVLSQNRADQTAAGVVGNDVHDNTIVMNTSGGWQNVALGFFQDWSGIMYDPASNNHGANNHYWYPQAENGSWRFSWSSSLSSLADSSATPGGQGGAYLSDAQASQVLSGAGLPTAP